MPAAPSPPDPAGYEAADPPAVVYGVDFSAAAADAGENTWITELAGGDGAATRSHSGQTGYSGSSLDSKADRPRVVDCAPATEFLDCGPSREETMPALVAFVRDLDGDAAVGFDFPFGVPRFLLEREGVADWRSFLAWLSDELADPVEFSGWGVDHTRAATDGERTYLGRRTDEETGARCPYDFIARYPAYYGMTEVLAPLVRNGDATVVPTMAHDPARPLVLETYPAAVLDGRGLYRERYKGTSDTERGRRRRNVDGLATELAGRPADVRTLVVEDAGGDALDSLAAAVAAWTNTRDPAVLPTRDADTLLEARIYA